MRAWWIAFAVLCLSSTGCGNSDDDPGEGEMGRMLIVAADQLEPAANRYADYRKSTGYQVVSEHRSQFLLIRQQGLQGAFRQLCEIRIGRRKDRERALAFEHIH